MSEHPNIALMKQVYDAFTVGDLETAAKYWTPDCVHHYPGRSSLAGSHSGVADAIKFAQEMFEKTQGDVQMEVLDIGASDDHAFALVRTSYSRNGKTIKDMPFVNIARVRDGKISEFWTYPDDQYTIDEFWAD
jgi:uncharacterized protein